MQPLAPLPFALAALAGLAALAAPATAQELSPNAGSVFSSVPNHVWVYFNVSIPAGQGFTVTLTPTQGDPDLYVGTAVPAAGSSYFSPNATWSSTWGTGTTDAVTVPASSSYLSPTFATTIYIGVYGFTAASFFLGVTTTNGGPVPSSTPVPSRSPSPSRSATPSRTPSASPVSITYLPMDGAPASGSAAQGTYTYFSTYVPAGARFTITLTPTTSGGDPDLYVGTTAPTSTTSFSAQWTSAAGAGSTDSVTSSYYLSLTQDTLVYIAVYGYRASGFTLRATSSGGSSATASRTATTTPSPTRSAAPSAQVPTTYLPMDGASAAASAAYRTYTYYFTYVPAGAGFTITLTPTTSGGDPDLYVGTTAPSSTTSFSSIWSSTFGGGSTDTVTVAASSSYLSPTQDTLLYVAVYGFTASGFTLRAASSTGGGSSPTTTRTATATPSPTRSPAPSAQVPLTLLTAGAGGTMTGSLAAGSYVYLYFSVPAGQGFTITLSPYSGDPDLYVGTTAPRAGTGYCCSGDARWSSVRGTGSTDSVSVAGNSPYLSPYTATTVFVGVYASGSANSAFTVTLAIPGGGGASALPPPSYYASAGARLTAEQVSAAAVSTTTLGIALLAVCCAWCHRRGAVAEEAATLARAHAALRAYQGLPPKGSTTATVVALSGAASAAARVMAAPPLPAQPQ